MAGSERVIDQTALGIIERLAWKALTDFTFQQNALGQALNVVLAVNPTVAAVTGTVSVVPSGEQIAGYSQQLSSTHYQQSFRRNLV